MHVKSALQSALRLLMKLSVLSGIIAYVFFKDPCKVAGGREA